MAQQSCPAKPSKKTVILCFCVNSLTIGISQLYLIKKYFFISNPLKIILEIFKSNNILNRWAFNWERKHVDGTIYRQDNIPLISWEEIETFPWHYHYKSEENVINSDFTNDITQNVQKLILIVKERIKI